MVSFQIGTRCGSTELLQRHGQLTSRCKEARPLTSEVDVIHHTYFEDLEPSSIVNKVQESAGRRGSNNDESSSRRAGEGRIERKECSRDQFAAWLLPTQKIAVVRTRSQREFELHSFSDSGHHM